MKRQASTQTAILLGFNSVTDPDTGWHICGSLFETVLERCCYRQTVEEYAKKKYSRHFMRFSLSLSLFSHACPFARFEQFLYTCHACIRLASDDDTSNATENEYARQCDLSLQSMTAKRNRSLKTLLWSRLFWQTTFVNATLT